jgi:hypothetical protein
MQAEFGRIPPAFLPVGTRYLIQHQLDRLPPGMPVWLSLPADFELDAAQERILDDRDVRVIRIDHKFSLGLSVFQALLEIAMTGPVAIVHGDTLHDLGHLTGGDRVSVAHTDAPYSWGIVQEQAGQVLSVRSGTQSDAELTEQSVILSGYFGFSDARALLQCLVRTSFDFIGALDAYVRERRVEAEVAPSARDFGHLKTYYASRHALAAARHFNELAIDGFTVRKRSNDARKIDAEANWFRSIPKQIQPFTARLIEVPGERSSGEYETTYANYPTVAELYLARPSRFVWRKILQSCAEYLALAADHRGPQTGALHWLAVTKLHERLELFPATLPPRNQDLLINGTGVGSLDAIVAHLTSVIAPAEPAGCVMHGDFCFSNILFDPRAERIMLIDPRGLVAGETTIYGDIRYDIAKLGHSIIGRYDQIVAQHLVARRPGSADFILEVSPDRMRDDIAERFRAMTVAGISFADKAIDATIVSLFLSMVPLHADDERRQITLFANALRLYAEFFGSTAAD